MPLADLGRVKLSFELRGEGLPVVLIMGLGTQRIGWPEPFLQGLEKLGCRLLLFDNRDVGPSTHFTHLGAPSPFPLLARKIAGVPTKVPYTLKAMAADTLALMDHVGFERAHIIGISMGGMIAQTLAIAAPDRAMSLLSIASTTGSRRHLFGTSAAYRALLSPRPRSREEAQDRTVRIYQAIGSPGFPLNEARIREGAGISFDRAQEPTGFLRQLAAILGSPSRVPELKSLRVPTLVVHGTEDPLIPVSGGEATAAAVPNARLLLIGGMGHDLPDPVHGAILSAWARGVHRGPL